MEILSNIGTTMERLLENHIFFDDEGNYFSDDYIVNEIEKIQVNYGITNDLSPKDAKRVAYNTTCLTGFILNENPKRYCNGIDLYQWVYTIARQCRSCGKIENPRKLWCFIVEFVEKHWECFVKCNDPEAEMCCHIMEMIKQSPDE